MKKFIYIFLFSIFLIGCATTNVENTTSDNKRAHKKLRREFENFSGFPELEKRGFDLNKLCEINDGLEMVEYLNQFFIDENGMPLDQHTSFKVSGKSCGDIEVKTQSQMIINYSDEYGTKVELLNKGYKEDEIFYFPYFNGEWKGGYRVGKKKMNNGPIHNSVYEKNYSVNSEKALLIGLSDFRGANEYEDDNKKFYDEISKSDKDYLILDLSYNFGGGDYSWYSLINAVKKMNPKEIFVLCSDMTMSMGDCATSWIEKASNIKTTVIGYPTWGGWKFVKTAKVIHFNDFTVNCKINDKELYSRITPKEYWDKYNLPYPTEGIGAIPDIYTDGKTINSLEVVKYLIDDDELSLPEDFDNGQLLQAVYTDNSDWIWTTKLPSGNITTWRKTEVWFYSDEELIYESDFEKKQNELTVKIQEKIPGCIFWISRFDKKTYNGWMPDEYAMCIGLQSKNCLVEGVWCETIKTSLLKEVYDIMLNSGRDFITNY